MAEYSVLYEHGQGYCGVVYQPGKFEQLRKLHNGGNIIWFDKEVEAILWVQALARTRKGTYRENKRGK